ncbi:MAG TPA: hypothetical protein VI978_02020 [Candidatus Paceibacterota bacterium]
MFKFNVVVAMENVGSLESFGEAFKVFFEKVKKLVAEGMSCRVLKTTCWIEYAGAVMYFYDARDLAYKVGVLKGHGELVEPLPKVDPQVVDIAFAEVGLKQAEQLFVELENFVKFDEKVFGALKNLAIKD